MALALVPVWNAKLVRTDLGISSEARLLQGFSHGAGQILQLGRWLDIGSTP